MQRDLPESKFQSDYYAGSPSAVEFSPVSASSTTELCDSWSDTNDCDSQLKHAVKECQRLNSVTPLLKEEIRLKIIARRHQEGKPELDLVGAASQSSADPLIVHLSTEVRQKIEQRKEKNREAAKKCRTKKKKEIDQLNSTLKKSQAFIQQLQQENKQLKEENANYKTALHKYDGGSELSALPSSYFVHLMSSD